MNRRNFLSAGLASSISATLLPAADAGGTREAEREGKSLPRIRVHADGHFLCTEDGAPFFWLGDTAWQLIQTASRDECSYYLATRARQGFTVIQTVVLAEYGGVKTPTTLGMLPFTDQDPSRPTEEFFDRVAAMADEAASLGLYLALVPAWGDKLTAPWGSGPRLFRNDNLDVARNYARYLALKLKERTNVVWVLGGDRPARLKGLNNKGLEEMARQAGFTPEQDWTPIWGAMADGLRDGEGSAPLILYHPQGGRESSSLFLQNEPWLSVNGMQSGHGGGHDVPVWEMIARDYAMEPAKPTLDLEPNYEDHPYNPWPVWNPANGYFRDYDVRKQVYRSVMAGGCGVTYGHNAIWQFAGDGHPPLFWPDRDWKDALFRPAGRQMIYLRLLLLSRPYFRRIPDQAMIAGDAAAASMHLQASRDRDGTYAFVYFPMQDQEARIDVTRLSGSQFKAWWYDTRTGIATPLPRKLSREVQSFRTPPFGPDWVLVIDSDEAGYDPPGLRMHVRT